MKIVLDINRGPGEQPDRDQLIAALQEAHRREHDLVQQLGWAQKTLAEGRAALEHTAGQLQTRTIERDHFQQDGHLWALCLAHLVNEGIVDTLPADDVNAMEGQMLSAEVHKGTVFLSVQERPQPSDEGASG